MVNIQKANFSILNLLINLFIHFRLKNSILFLSLHQLIRAFKFIFSIFLLNLSLFLLILLNILRFSLLLLHINLLFIILIFNLNRNQVNINPQHYLLPFIQIRTRIKLIQKLFKRSPLLPILHFIPFLFFFITFFIRIVNIILFLIITITIIIMLV